MISQEKSFISVEPTCGLRKHFLHNTNDFDYYSQAKIISFFQDQSMFGQSLPPSLLPSVQHTAQLMPPG